MSREIKHEYFECHGIHNVGIYAEKGRMLGRALIINPSDGNPPVLLDIYIYEEKDRRKGCADELLYYCTERIGDMITSYLSSAGRDLCLKHGFRLRRGRKKGEIDLLIYVKGEQDAIKEGEVTEDGQQKRIGTDALGTPPEAGSGDSAG
jgi:hypothetical protein